VNFFFSLFVKLQLRKRSAAELVS